MIIVALALVDAEPLLRLLRQRGFVAVTRQIDAQIGAERLLPTEALPVLSVRFEDELNSLDVFDPDLALAMYEGLHQGATTHHQKCSKKGPT